jgi:hypothetical protein
LKAAHRSNYALNCSKIDLIDISFLECGLDYFGSGSRFMKEFLKDDVEISD